jgi:hypothetical protein
MKINRYIFLAILFLAVPFFSKSSFAEVPITEIDIPAQSDWIDYGMIFKAGEVGEWDHLLWGGFANSVINIDGKYLLYYQGSEYYRTEFDESVMWRSIGAAVSEDGVNFVKYSGNPILTWFPNKNGEEGAVSSGVTLGDSGEVVIFYGANTEETSTTVNADARVAVSQDGLQFVDVGIVLDHTNPKTWGFGDELFPIGAIHDLGRWIVYYLPNGVPQSGKLGVAYGDKMDSLPITSQVKSGNQEIAAWGTTGHAKIGENTYALFLTNLRAGTIEVRLLSPDKPAQISHPIQTYPIKIGQQATIWLDKDRSTWFMYYQDDKWYGLKMAPAGIPDRSPPSTPSKLIALDMEDGMVDLSWQPAEDADTGIVHYLVYRDGELIGTVKGRYFSDPDSSQSTNATYQVSAVNFHGFEGNLSAPVRVKRSCAP